MKAEFIATSKLQIRKAYTWNFT